MQPDDEEFEVPISHSAGYRTQMPRIAPGRDCSVQSPAFTPSMEIDGAPTDGWERHLAKLLCALLNVFVKLAHGAAQVVFQH